MLYARESTSNTCLLQRGATLISTHFYAFLRITACAPKSVGAAPDTTPVGRERPSRREFPARLIEGNTELLLFERLLERFRAHRLLREHRSPVRPGKQVHPGRQQTIRNGNPYFGFDFRYAIANRAHSDRVVRPQKPAR